MSRTRARLEKLEAAIAPRSGVVVVTGYSDAEHEAKIAELRAKGELEGCNLIVCIRKFFPPDEDEGTRDETF
jgi:hypothetical protein